MDKVDEEYLKEILEHGSGSSESEKIKAHDVSVKDEGLSMDALQVRKRWRSLCTLGKQLCSCL